MGLTISFLSALDAMRTIRSNGISVQEMDTTLLTQPVPWAGKHWSMKEFESSKWQWGIPTADDPLHVLVPQLTGRPRMAYVRTHLTRQNLPSRSILWADECTSIVCPELLFLQMVSVFSFPALVLLGYELCGNFSRSALDPLNGHVEMNIPAATSVDRIREYILASSYGRGASVALRALDCVSDHALSAPEALLAAMYSMPTNEAGYDMGPITLNEKVRINCNGDSARKQHRYPDITLSSIPIGINYDGEGHFELDGLKDLIRHAESLEGEEYEATRELIHHKLDSIRKKMLDDNMRNRELAAAGRIVMVVTKDDLYGKGNLDILTRQMLDCAHNAFGLDVQKHVRILDDTDAARDRNELLESFLPGGRPFGAAHGKM